MVKKSELKGKSTQELHTLLRESHKELMALRSKASSGGSLESPGRIVVLRRMVARILTLLHTQEKTVEVVQQRSPAK